MIKDQKFSRICRQGALGAAGVVFLGATLFSAPGRAQDAAQSAKAPGPDPSAYARYYGDGIRQYAEGRFSEAARNLLRAYALNPRAGTMALVVRAYDEMGFCDAVDRQRELYASVHPQAPVPRAARCERAGQVTVECVGVGGPILDERVRVDGRFQVACGRQISLPAGAHQLAPVAAEPPEYRATSEARAQRATRRVSVVAGQQTSAQVRFYDPPTRWKLVDRPAVDPLTDLTVRVERLEGQKLDYTVYLTEEGLYRVFIHPGTGSIPAYNPSVYHPVPLRPEVLRLCDSGERFDPEIHRCAPVKSLEIQKFD